MPEIAEVARVVHYLRKHLVGKTLAAVKAQEDNNVFGKAATTAAEFQKAMTGKKVLDAGQQGKYFWLIMSSPPHPVMHFGMTGWLKFRNEETFYYKPSKGEEKEEWPPKFWKFLLETAEEPKCEAAFVDSRRFSRVRLVDCDADAIRRTTPLKENGPDPVIDRHIVTEEWLVEKLRSKRVPVKALLLDQANISGIGNWVGDEILYNARVHPEQYSNTLTDSQLSQLHKSILYVCSTAVDLLADSERFPEEWLFKHRWGKGKKDQKQTLPNGDKIVYLTVGGRTSAVVPSVQKKTGPVAADVDATNSTTNLKANKNKEEDVYEESSKKRKVDVKSTVDEPSVHPDADSGPENARKRRGKKADTKAEPFKASVGQTRKSAADTKAASSAKKEKQNGGRKEANNVEPGNPTSGPRRSSRVTRDRG